MSPCLRGESLRSHFDDSLSDPLLATFQNVITELAKRDIEEMTRDFEHDTELAEWRKIGRREALRRKSSACAGRRRSPSASAVLDSNGLAALDYDHASVAIGSSPRRLKGSSYFVPLC